MVLVRFCASHIMLLMVAPLQVSYRYNVVKARMQLLQARLADVNAMVGICFRQQC